MKKVFLFTALMLCIFVLLTSCETTNKETTLMNQVFSEGMVFNTYFDREDFTILGTVRGESDYVYYSRELLAYVGDSYNYGYISEIIRKRIFFTGVPALTARIG